MALGFGSEFHLLRWMGRHRNQFDIEIKKLLNIENVYWLDFEFNSKKSIPDSELSGISFLSNVPEYSTVRSKWCSEWPQQGNSMNWDLVGYTIENGVKKWILVEAKAHIGEIDHDCNASEKSLEKISKAFQVTAKNNGINISADMLWTKKYYQMANRLYMLDLLRRSGINALLIDIYFVGDLISKKRESPQEKKTWGDEIVNCFKYLNIDDPIELGIFNLFLDVDK